MAKVPGMRQSVKKGLITAESALSELLKAEFRSATAVQWLQSRIRRGVKVEAPKPPEPAAEKTPSKSVERRVKPQREYGKKRG